MDPTLILSILLLVLWVIMGQGVYALHRRARKSNDLHGMCLAVWPLLLIMLCFMDSSLEW